MMMSFTHNPAFTYSQAQTNEILACVEASLIQSQRMALGLTPDLLLNDLNTLIHHHLTFTGWLKHSVATSYPHLVSAFEKVEHLLHTIHQQAPVDMFTTLATLSDLHWHINQEAFSPEFIRLMSVLSQYINNWMGLYLGASHTATPIESLINVQSTQYMLMAQMQLLEGEVTQKVLSFTQHPMHDLLLTIQEKFPVGKQG
jgi:hypothetical protein